MAVIAHIAIVDDWESARNLGEYTVSTRGVSLDDVGFVHATSLDGVASVLAHHYADVRFELLLVILNTDALTADGIEVTENAVGQPQVLGSIQTDGAAVVAVVPIERADGGFVVPDLSRLAGAS